MKKVLVLVMAFALLLPIGVSAAVFNEFYDLPTDHWAHQDITRLYELNLFSGYPDNTFKPDSLITRAEFIKVMSLAAIREEESDVDITFLDKHNLKKHWAYEYIQSAAKKGILLESDSMEDINLGNIDSYINRAEMALIMSRAFKDDVMTYELPLNDVNGINAKHKEAISKIFGKEIIKGYPDNSFKPYNDSTRAEACVVINRYIKLLNLSDADLKGRFDKTTPYAN